jgi:16S rRNA (guanine527-N7)-methyltransferase
MKIEDFLRENQDLLNKLTEFMLEYNSHTNLTRITEPDEIVEKHYIDSVLPLTLYNVPRGTFPASQGTIVLDVGSGAGFPGVLWKLFRPDLSVTLLDSARKRTDYLSLLLRHIGVDCGVVTGRSEDLAHESVYRERYDVVTARAVANLASLCEYCLPLVKVGGVFLAMKGELSVAERNQGFIVAHKLGGQLQDVKKYRLPKGDVRNLVIIRKTSQTPTNYPRSRVNITKNPIA